MRSVPRADLVEAILEAHLVPSAPWHGPSCDLEALFFCEQGQLLRLSATPGH